MHDVPRPLAFALDTAVVGSLIALFANRVACDLSA